MTSCSPSFFPLYLPCFFEGTFQSSSRTGAVCGLFFVICPGLPNISSLFTSFAPSEQSSHPCRLWRVSFVSCQRCQPAMFCLYASHLCDRTPRSRHFVFFLSFPSSVVQFDPRQQLQGRWTTLGLHTAHSCQTTRRLRHFVFFSLPSRAVPTHHRFHVSWPTIFPVVPLPFLSTRSVLRDPTAVFPAVPPADCLLVHIL